ncbi:hypothetical protein C8F04DRAFT_1198153 [Mycena alexandri]|uniref:Uncharacterized protein n=1 Tax=Mycena alexandri TaxID=1745969 RepID=A0AAD6S0J6_9AGAR|nr:hypothetical protein C8F04DRAFT_1198153 [Mycena alexandri]
MLGLAGARNSEPSSKPKLRRKRRHQTPIYSSSESKSESLSKQQSKTKHKKPNLVAREEEPNAKEPLFLPSDGDGPEQEVEEINNRIDMTGKDPGTQLFYLAFNYELFPALSTSICGLSRDSATNAVAALRSNGSIWLRQICALVLSPFVGMRLCFYAGFVGAQSHPHIAFANTGPNLNIAFVGIEVHLHATFVDAEARFHIASAIGTASGRSARSGKTNH